MTFKDFEKIVKEKRPDIEVFQQYKNKVSVVFNLPNGKMNDYYGNYCEVLNKLGIKAIYERDLKSLERHLEYLKENHGQECIWGCIWDNLDAIARYEADIANYKQNYIIVKE